MKKIFSRKHFLGLIIILAILSISILFIYQKNLIPRSDINFIIQDKQKASSNILPSFNYIHGVVERNGEKWIASDIAIRIKDGKVKFFTQQDGLPASRSWSVINHKNQIWFGLQGGLAKYNDKTDRFEAQLVGESNPMFFEDPFTQKLYLSTFDHVYYYNDDDNSWQEAREGDAPNNARQMVFTERFVFSSSFQNALPVVVLDKNSSKDGWSRSLIPEFGNQQILTLFRVNNRIFIYGRSKDYNGCSEYGKAPSSIFFEHKGRNFNNEDVWEPVNELNDYFKKSEPSIISEKISDGTQIKFYDGVDCYEKTKKDKTVTFDFSNDKIVLSSEIDGGKPDESVGKYLDVVAEIENITHQPAYINIQAIDKDGNLYVSTSENQNSFSIIKADENYKAKEILSQNELKDFNQTLPLICTNSGKEETYILAALVNEMGGETVKIKIYKVINDLAQELEIGSKIPIALPESSQAIICKDNAIYWPDIYSEFQKISMKKYDLNNFSETKLTEVNPESYTSAYGVDTENMWFMINGNKKLYHYSLDNNQFNEINIENLNLPSDIINIILVEKDKIWLSCPEKSSGGKIVVVDSKGNKIKDISLGGDGSKPNIVSLGENRYLASTSSGLYLIDFLTDKIIKLDHKKLPFWGNEANFMPSLLRFDFYLDSQNNKIWFNNTSVGAFALKLSDLNINIITW